MGRSGRCWLRLWEEIKEQLISLCLRQIFYELCRAGASWMMWWRICTSPRSTKHFAFDFPAAHHKQIFEYFIIEIFDADKSLSRVWVQSPVDSSVLVSRNRKQLQVQTQDLIRSLLLTLLTRMLFIWRNVRQVIHGAKTPTEKTALLLVKRRRHFDKEYSLVIIDAIRNMLHLKYICENKFYILWSEFILLFSLSQHWPVKAVPVPPSAWR